MIRFLTLGLADIESRLSRYFHDHRTDDGAVASLVSASRIVRGIDRMLLIVLGAIESSSTHRVVTGVQSAWESLTRARRRELIGVCLVVAAVVNITATIAFQSVPGWLWSVPPAMVATIGAFMMSAGSQEQR